MIVCGVQNAHNKATYVFAEYEESPIPTFWELCHSFNTSLGDTWYLQTLPPPPMTMPSNAPFF